MSLSTKPEHKDLDISDAPERKVQVEDKLAKIRKEIDKDPILRHLSQFGFRAARQGQMGG